MYYYFFGTIILAFVLWTVGSLLAVRNIEEPKYTVLEKRNGYEIRQYESYIIAQTEVTGSYSGSLNQGFRVIADYIFGNNTSQSSIAMTAPVLESTSEKIAMTVPVVSTMDDAQTRKISFVLPSEYTMETLPKPNNASVTLIAVPSRRVAALQFNWYATERRAATKQTLLEERISKDELIITGVAEVAQYNPPFSMPLIRRNEIIIPVDSPPID
jgi:hypothetical protein